MQVLADTITEIIKHPSWILNPTTYQAGLSIQATDAKSALRGLREALPLNLHVPLGVIIVQLLTANCTYPQTNEPANETQETFKKALRLLSSTIDRQGFVAAADVAYYCCGLELPRLNCPETFRQIIIREDEQVREAFSRQINTMSMTSFDNLINDLPNHHIKIFSKENRLLEIYNLIASRAIKSADYLEPESLSNLAKVFAQVSHDQPEDFFKMLTNQAIINQDQFNLKQIGRLMEAYAILSIELPEILIDCFINKFTKALTTIDPENPPHGFQSNLCKVAWSLVILAPEKLPLLLNEIPFSVMQFNESDERKLALTTLIAGKKYTQLRLDTQLILGDPLTSNSSITNSFEKTIAQYLLRSLPDFNVYSSALLAGFEIDLVLSNNNEYWLIECDGDQFHQTTSGKKTGKDLFKDQAIRKLDLPVIRLLSSEVSDHFDITKLLIGKAEDAKKNLLNDRNQE